MLQNESGDIPAVQNGEVGDDNDRKQKRKVKSQISLVELDKMVVDSLKDIDVYDDDGDDDDPALLNELSQIIEPEKPKENEVTAEPSADIILPTTNFVPEVLKTRMEMYKIAEANAVAANESSRARRFGRGLQTLDTMLKQALAGEPIDMESIPPEVITKATDGTDISASAPTEKELNEPASE